MEKQVHKFYFYSLSLYYRYVLLGYFTIASPTQNEKVQLSELIDGIKQFQDEEFQYMRAEFERVEKLLASDNEPNSIEDNINDIKLKGQSSSSSMIDDSMIQLPPDRVSENQPQFVEQYGNTEIIRNHSQYVMWTLLFFVILFFGVMMKLYLARFTDNFSSIFEFLHLKN